MDLEKLKIERPPAQASRKRRGRRPGVGAFVFLIALAVALVLFWQPMMRSIDRLRLPVVEVHEVVRPSRVAASAVSGISANGYVVARNRAALSADTPGRVVEMNVEEGSVVKKGDVVARLFSDEYAAALQSSEGEVELATLLIETRTEQVRASESELEVRRAGVTEAEARVAETLARLDLARLQKERAERLVAQNVQTQQALDEAEAELLGAQAGSDASEAALNSARLAVLQSEHTLAVGRVGVREASATVKVKEATRDQARATLDKTQVRAPFDGVVILKDAEVGEVVSPNAQGGGNSRGSVVTMVDFSSLEVQVEVPETNLAAVVLGENANIYLDAYPQDLFLGEVQRIFPTANRQKATIEVRVVFLNPDDRLRPEMGVRVVFAPRETASADDADTLAGENVVLIPKSCVASIDGVHGVFVLERDVARWRPVDQGPRKGDKIAILSGLAEGERIVVDPPGSLQNGDRVQARN